MEQRSSLNQTDSRKRQSRVSVGLKNEVRSYIIISGITDEVLSVKSIKIIVRKKRNDWSNADRLIPEQLRSL